MKDAFVVVFAVYIFVIICHLIYLRIIDSIHIGRQDYLNTLRSVDKRLSKDVMKQLKEKRSEQVR